MCFFTLLANKNKYFSITDVPDFNFDVNPAGMETLQTTVVFKKSWTDK